MAVALSIGLLAAQSAAFQQPRFRSAIDLVLVDVQIGDRDGRPVLGLAPGDFSVTINGRLRRVVSADFITSSADPGTPFPADASPPQRAFVVAIDAASFAPGDALGVVRAAREFVARVPATDPVGVFTLPVGARLDPTTDRRHVSEVLNQVIGQRTLLQSAYDLSVLEIVDITSQAGHLRTMSAGRGGATPQFPVSFEMETLRQVQQRECDPRDHACIEGIVADAEALSHEIEEHVRQSLSSLGVLLDRLSSYPGRKTVVVLSGGMPASDRIGGRPNVGRELKELGERAARANATVYSIHVDLRPETLAESRSVRQARAPARERLIQSKLLGDFAVPSGGALLSVLSGYGEDALSRVLLETSGYYLLGVEPASGDRNGRTHQLRVTVAAPGATVRSRQWAVIPREPARRPTPAK